LKRKPSNLRRLGTEQSNAAATNLDQKSSLDIARLINAEDSTVAAAVGRALPQIARAIDLVAVGLRKGGRLIYVGAGTSGRIAALDAAECSPTFNTNPRSVQFVMAGGPKALATPSEASEDDTQLARKEMAKRKPGKHDVVLGIASSGRTPFTVAAIEFARHRGAKTIALTCNRNSPLERAADFAVVTEVGPEVLAGSSRMKAGTAHKMLRLRQPDGQCCAEERKAHPARHWNPRARHRSRPRNRQPHPQSLRQPYARSVGDASFWSQPKPGRGRSKESGRQRPQSDRGCHNVAPPSRRLSRGRPAREPHTGNQLI
jgi:D-arabinose 5-phosphate isomerase GutQ